MGAPSKQALEFQRHLISVDAATMKVAKMSTEIQTLYSKMEEKDRTIELLQEQITQLKNELLDLRNNSNNIYAGLSYNELERYLKNQKFQIDQS